MLNVIPKPWSYAFSVTDEGVSIAQSINLSWWRDRSDLRIDGKNFRARCDSRSFVLESEGKVVARAKRPRLFARALNIEYSDHRYKLRAKSAFRRQFLLMDGATQIGSISPQGLFSRKAVVDLPETLPLFLRVFIIWLTMTLWKQDDATGGALS
jgi:hypothetical protein